MVSIDLDVINLHEKSCSLDRTCFEGRLDDLQKGLFSQSESYSSENGKLKVIFNLKTEILHELADFISTENICCGDFVIDIHIDMIKQKIEVMIK